MRAAISETQPDLPAGEYAEISINDSGTGIPDDVREHIFRSILHRQAEDRGTSLGLPMVYSYVKRMLQGDPAGIVAGRRLPSPAVPERYRRHRRRRTGAGQPSRQWRTDDPGGR